MDTNLSVSDDQRSVEGETVDLDAGYAFDGKEYRPTRVHKVSLSGLRILTHERITLRRLITIGIVIDADHRTSLLGRVTRLVSLRRGLYDYEVILLDENPFLRTLRSNAIKTNRGERRPATRIKVDLEASYTLNGATCRTCVHEISASGLRITTDHELRLTSLLTINIRFDKYKRVDVMVQVVRLAGRNGMRYDYGLRVTGAYAMKNPLRAIVLHLLQKGAVDPKVRG